MKAVKVRSYMTLVQIIVLLCLAAGLIFYKKDWVIAFFETTQTGQTEHMGLLLNGFTLVLFLFGLFRITMVLLSYTREQSALNRFIERMRDKVANPTYNISQSSMIAERYHAVKQISMQNSPVDQSALAVTLAASQMSRYTLIRFVHNTLILSGVFGTIVSLSLALVGAAGLLDSPDSLEKMGTIIGGMSTALSTTITAIICYVFYTYFHLRLQDIRTQLLANVEEVTTLYLLPQFRTVEGNLMHDVSILAAELKSAAQSVTHIQDRFLQAGDRLQLAVDDLQASIGPSSQDIRIIRESLREGFRLDAESHGDSHSDGRANSQHPDRNRPV